MNKKEGQSLSDSSRPLRVGWGPDQISKSPKRGQSSATWAEMARETYLLSLAVWERRKAFLIKDRICSPVCAMLSRSVVSDSAT